MAKKRSRRTTRTRKTAKTSTRKTTPVAAQTDRFDLVTHLKSNLNFYLSLLVTLVLSLGVWFYFDDRVTRFSFIMPLVATWIFYLILTEVED